MKRVESRNSLLAKIHIAKKDLGLDDDAYRAFVERVTGHASAGKCSLPELVRLVAEFRKKGWNPPSPAPRAKAAAPKGGEALVGKIMALLDAAGRTEEYAVGIARRMYKKDALAFCTPKELQSIVAALVRDAKRHGRAA